MKKNLIKNIISIILLFTVSISAFLLIKESYILILIKDTEPSVMGLD